MKRKLIMSTLSMTVMLGFNTLAFADTTNNNDNTQNGNQQELTYNNGYVNLDKAIDISNIDKSNTVSLDVKATAYAGDTITSTGTVPTEGTTIAVDPSIIPYGSKVYIPEFDKVFIAEDCGSAIKGNRIDIFMDSEAKCNDWGVKNITIYVLK